MDKVETPESELLTLMRNAMECITGDRWLHSGDHFTSLALDFLADHCDQFSLGRDLATFRWRVSIWQIASTDVELVTSWRVHESYGKTKIEALARAVISRPSIVLNCIQEARKRFQRWEKELTK